MKNKVNRRVLNRTILTLSTILILTLLTIFAHNRAYIELPSKLISILTFSLTTMISLLGASVFIKITEKRFLNSFSNLQVEQKLLLTKSYSFVIYLVSLIIILWDLGLQIQNITLLVGIIATGLAFTVREILINYFAWFMFLTKKPFRIGDHIEIGENEGQIQHIGTFYVVLDDSPEDKNNYLRIPNKTFLEKPIMNYGKSPFTFNVIYPLHKEMKSVSIEKLKTELEKEIEQTISIELTSDKDSLKLIIKMKTESYEQRNILKTKILSKLIEKIPFKS